MVSRESSEEIGGGVPVKRTGDIKIGLKRITPEIEQALRPVIETVAELVQRDAQVSITNGAVSGKNHVPSAPGTPPNNDSGDLANGITVERVNALRCRVVSTAPHAAIQELGGTINHPGGTPYFIGSDGKAVFVSKQGAGAFHGLPVTKPHTITLPERPYMRPAGVKNAENGRKLMKAAVARVLKGDKVT